MAQLRITLGDEQIGAKISKNMKRNAAAVLEALRATAEDAAQEIEDRGRADISSAGNFGSRWTDGFNARVGEGGGAIRITVTMAVPYWTVFQHGKTIEGKPLLWIPLDFASDAKGVSARDYPGQLFRVDRISGEAPLLMTPGKPAQPKYFGKESVTIPKKFHLIEIIRQVAKRMPAAYRKNFKQAVGG